MKINFLLPAIVLTLTGCTRCSNKESTDPGTAVEIKNDTVPETTTAAQPYSFEMNAGLSNNLLQQGLQAEKVMVKTDTAGFTNSVTAYILFEKGFFGSVKAIVYNKNDKEIGQSLIQISAGKGNAGYFDFSFNTPIKITGGDKIVLE